MYKDKEKEKQTKKRYYQKHEEELKKYQKKWYQEHKKIDNQRSKKWRETYPNYGREYYQKHKKKDNQRSKKYRQGHKKERNQHQNERRKTDIKFRLDGNIGTAIHNCLKGEKQGIKWQMLVGYTLRDLMEHLEKQFDNEMSWENYGSYWWVDHIKPRSLFNFTCPEDKEFKECWALSNLQPLEKVVNMRKGNKY